MIGSIIIHYINLIFSIVYGNKSQTNQCSWYNSSVLIDTTFGILIDYALLVFFTFFLELICPISANSGNYYKIKFENGKKKASIYVLVYIIQLITWIVVVSLMKLIVILIQITFPKECDYIGNLLLYFFRNSETMMLIFSIIIFPMIMNIFQYWVQDNFIKKNEFNQNEDKIILETFYELDETSDEVDSLLKGNHNDSTNIN